MDVLAAAEVVKRASLVGIQVEVEVVGTLFEPRHATGREFEAFQIGEAVRVAPFEDVSRTLEVDFAALDEPGFKPCEGAIPSPVGHDTDVQSVVGVGEGIGIFKHGEMDLLMRATQREVVGFAGLGFDTAEVFEHHETPRGHDPLRGVGVEHLEEVVAAERPSQIGVGQPQAVVGEIHLGAKTGLVVLHRRAVKPLDVFAGVQV